MLRCARGSRAIQCTTPWRLCSQIRRFGATTIHRSAPETITVDCASNGSISLLVHHPLVASTPTSSQTAAIFLPRGPILEDPAQDAANMAVLRSILSCPIVQINYRYGKVHQFPTPIHDVLAGFDWVVANMLPKRAFARAGRSEHVGKLAVAGELLGGQLATVLALTECRVGEPGIMAAAVNNPIVDWVDLPLMNTFEASLKPRVFSSRTLLDQRDKLFRKLEHCYDPFASPALFFRTAGYEVPEDVAEPALSEMDELAVLAREEYMRENGPASGTSLDQLATQGLGDEDNRIKKRKSSRRYPPKQLGLNLPAFHITAGADSPIAHQADELSNLLGQSFQRLRKSNTLKDPAAMVQSDQHPGLGLWDNTEPGRTRITTAANWISKNLGQDIQ